jgi:hypothetical protein
MFLREPDFVTAALEKIPQLSIELLLGGSKERASQVDLHRSLSFLFPLYELLPALFTKASHMRGGER